MDDRDDRQIEALTQNVLANLTVEELEQRLELQLLQMPEGGLCYFDACGLDCNSNNQCGSNCGCNGVNTCNADAGGGCGLDSPCASNNTV